MSKPTPQRLMKKELARKAIRKQKLFEALPAKIKSKRFKKAIRANRPKQRPYVKAKEGNVVNL